MASRLWRVFELDLRSLALLRIALGGIVLTDVAVRLQDLKAHYTEAGVLPVSALRELFPATPEWMLGLVASSETEMLAVFAATGLCAAMLLLGYHTRLATVACWGLVLCVQRRNFMVLNGGDDLLRLLLFWSMFLPLGARLSVDRLRTRQEPGEPLPIRVRSVASAALVLQICVVYAATALLKSDPSWRTEGSAVFYALSIDQFATPLTPLLLQVPKLLPPLTWATLGLEALGPFLILCPWRTQTLRALAVASFVALHVGLALFLELGLFPAVCIAGWLALIPTRVWGLARRGTGAELRGLAPALGAGRATGVVAGAAIVWVLAWNATSVAGLGWDRPGLRTFRALGIAAGLNQHWDMFAPRPLTWDGWYVAPARLVDGSRIDLLRERRVSWQKPERVAADYPNQRWRKYMMNLIKPEMRHHRRYFARYVCSRWNGSHASARRAEEVELVFVREETRPGHRTDAPRPMRLLVHSCAGGERLATTGK